MLYLLNDLLPTVAAFAKWIMYVMEMVFSPEIYAVMRLLLVVPDERTEEECLMPLKNIISLLNMDVLINPTAESFMALMQIYLRMVKQTSLN